VIAERAIAEGRLRPGRGCGAAALRRINDRSINHKIYGERFVKPHVLACYLSGPFAGLHKAAW
jgi:hypothetical protein